MRRREFLAGLGALASTGVPRLGFAKKPRLQVGVVGAGIIGASIAFHLARAGAEVTVFEKTAPAAGATSKSFAWINAFVDDPHYQELRLRSVAAWHELDEPLQLNVSWGGSLWWAQSPNDFAEIRAASGQMGRTVHPMRTLSDRELVDLSPEFHPKALQLATFCGLDGHVDPVWATRRFLDHAAEAGARIVHPCEVTRIVRVTGRLARVATTQGSYDVDRLVVAGGIDSPGLLAQVDGNLPMQHAPGILAHSAPMKHLTAIMHRTPNFLSLKQMTDGRIVAADSELPPDTPVHREIRERMMDYPDDAIRTMHGKRVLEKVTAVFPAMGEATFDRLTLGFRPIPEDGFPVIGFVGFRSDVYAAVMHSGVTLAPLVGRYAAEEILGVAKAEMLAPYRPRRFETGRAAAMSFMRPLSRGFTVGA